MPASVALHMLFPLFAALFHSLQGALVVTLCQALGWALGRTDESDQFLTSRISEEKGLTEEEAQVEC